MKHSLIFILPLLLLACKSKQAIPDNATLYRDAIKESMYPESKKIDSNLIAITKQNPKLTRKIINGEDYILCVTWKATNYYPDSGAYSTGKYQIWVTTAPELLERMKQEKAKDVNMRLKQLLGLPPVAEYKLFVEFWVRPQDMFRPCPDKEINDSRCNICFTAQDSTDMNYINWVNESRISRYYACGLYNQYPWSELGYTYDWNPNNKTHIGLCEFVIDKNKTVYVNKIYSTSEYLQKAGY